jgi:hypothetical protein
MKKLYYKISVDGKKIVMNLSDLLIYIKKQEDYYEYNSDSGFKTFKVQPIWLTKKEFYNIKILKDETI